MACFWTRIGRGLDADWTPIRRRFDADSTPNGRRLNADCKKGNYLLKKKGPMQFAPNSWVLKMRQLLKKGDLGVENTKPVHKTTSSC